MVDVGELRIVGTIDTSNVAQGLQSMKQGLDSAKSSARSTFGDMKNLGSSIKEIGSGMLKVGGIVGGTMLGLAAFSPAVAPSLARMKTEFSAMGRTIGEEFQPLFDYAANKFSEFTTWLGSDEGRGVLQNISYIVKELGDFFVLLGDAIAKVPKYLGITLDFLFGDGAAAEIFKALAPGVAAALLTYAVTKNVPLSLGIGGAATITSNVEDVGENKLWAQVATGATAGAAFGALAGSFIPGIGTVIGGLIGAAAGGLTGVGSYLIRGGAREESNQSFEQQYYEIEEYNNRESTVANSMRYLNTGS
jgi:hypothetical protein